MRRKILVALDGSPAAALALPTAQTIAAQLRADVEVVHVASEATPTDDLRARLGLDSSDGTREDLTVLIGDPVKQLLMAAARRDVAFVVLAIHGHGVDSGRLARVPEALAANATRPILLVRPEAVAALGHHSPYPFKRMLLPFDGTAANAAALKPAVKLAEELGAAIDLLYVVHPGQARPDEPGGITPPLYVDQPYFEWPGWATEVRCWLRSCCEHAGEDVPIDVYVRTGEMLDGIGAAITQFADQQEADAIVLVRRSHLEPGRGPVLRAVLERTPCPVFLVAGRPARRRQRAHEGTGAAWRSVA